MDVSVSVRFDILFVISCWTFMTLKIKMEFIPDKIIAATHIMASIVVERFDKDVPSLF